MNWCILSGEGSASCRIIGPMSEEKANQVVKKMQELGSFGLRKKRMIEADEFVTVMTAELGKLRAARGCIYPEDCKCKVCLEIDEWVKEVTK